MMTILRGLCEFQLNKSIKGAHGRTLADSNSWSNWNFNLNVSFYEDREKRIENMNEKKRLKRRNKQQTKPDYEAEIGMPA